MEMNPDMIFNKITDEILPDLTKTGMSAARSFVKGAIDILEKTIEKIDGNDSDSFIPSHILNGMHESAFDLITSTIGAVLTSHRRAEYESSIGKQAFIKDFCCISLSLPKGTGNTTLLLHLAKYYQNARILCRDSGAISTMKKIIDNAVSSSPLKDRLLSNIYSAENSGSVKPGIVLVDKGSSYSKAQKEALVRPEDEFYVFIG
jgi:hypothetical protein